MSNIYNETLDGVGTGIKWHVVINTSSSSNDFNVTATFTCTAAYTFDLNLESKDIWLTMYLDGSSKEYYRWYISKGQYQSFSGSLPSVSITKTYRKTNATQNKTIKFRVDGSATHYTNMLGCPERSVSFTIPSGHIHPKGLKVASLISTTTSISTEADWTPGKGADAKVDVNLDGANTKTIDGAEAVSWSGLTPNKQYTLNYELWDVPTGGGAHRNLEKTSRSIWTKLKPPVWGSISSTTNSVSLSVSANGNSTTNLQYEYSKDNRSWGTSSTFSGLDDNTEYTFYARCKNTSTKEISGSISTTYWTHPILDDIAISLVPTEEHSSFTVTAKTYTNSDLMNYKYKENTIDSTEYETAATSATWRSSDGVRENTTYTVRVRSKNRKSGFESATRSVSITTWHNPLSGFSVQVTNRWYYELSAKCSFSYSGTVTIYMAIGDDQNWIDKGHSSGVVHIRNGLSPNTLYNIWAYIQDEHGRIYGNKSEKITTAYTLDDRSIYANGELKHLYSNGALQTPDKVYVIQGDGTKICMNKIINNDPREG